MCQEFKTLSEKISYCGSSEHIIGMLVEKHNKVISFSENLDVLFSFMALMQIFWNTLVICSLGLLIIAVSVAAPVRISCNHYRNLLSYSDPLTVCS